MAAAVFVFGTSVSFSQVVDTSDWVCEFCPFESGYRADFEAGTALVDDDSARFGSASGYDEDGAYLDFSGEGSLVRESFRSSWRAEDLGLDSRALEFEGGEPGRYDFRVAYRELPQHLFDTTQTIFRESAADTLSLPSGWDSAHVTSGFSALTENLAARDIESERETLEIGGRYLASSRYRVSAEFRRQKREGVDITNGSYFTQSSQLPRPFDYETDEFDVNLNYLGSNFQFELGYYASLFDNNNAALNWDNPFISAVGAESAALAQPPENTFHQVSLSGSYRFSAYDTVLSFTGASGRIEQDDAFLPYTSNTQLTVGSLPRAQLDAEVDTTNIGLKLTSRPHNKLRVSAAYRFDERDNKTPIESWTRVITDTFNSGEVETNVPYSFEKTQLKLSAEYALRPAIRLSAGYDRTERDRDFQEVASQTERTGWTKLRWRPNALLSIDVKGGTSQRDIDRYNETLATALGQNPLLRKYNLAYRFREFAELRVSASLPVLPISVSGTVHYANDDYSQTLIGITEDDDVTISADMNWALSDNTSLYVFSSYEDIEAKQTGSEQFATPDWRATNKDSFYTVGTGARISEIGENFDLSIDYIHSDGTSEITTFSVGGSSSPFPDLESKLDSIRLSLTWRRTERQELVFRLQHEAFESDDWALQGVGPATIPTVLTLGAKPYDYDVTLIGASFRYLVGE